MGLYDTYEGVQLKAGECQCNEYRAGDTVNIPDGVYLGYTGVIVIINSILTAKLNHLINSDGLVIDIKPILDAENRLTKVIDDFEKKKGRKG